MPAATRSSPPPARSRTTSESWAISPSRSLPEGYRLRTVEPADLEARVELHRVVWEPSRVTVESFSKLQTVWPYRADLDCVVEAPDGSLVAYCLAWLDDANRVGELEPVGTHPDYRRRGLASAVCLFALHRLQEEGATRGDRLLDRGLGGDGALRVDRPAPARALAPAPEATGRASPSRFAAGRTSTSGR